MSELFEALCKASDKLYDLDQQVRDEDEMRKKSKLPDLNLYMLTGVQDEWLLKEYEKLNNGLCNIYGKSPTEIRNIMAKREALLKASAQMQIRMEKDNIKKQYKRELYNHGIYNFEGLD